MIVTGRLADYLMLCVITSLVWTVLAQSAAAQNTSCPGDVLAGQTMTQDFVMSNKEQRDLVGRWTAAASAHSRRHPHSADVEGIYFAAGADFDNARLDTASFIRVAFEGGAGFNSTTFVGPTVFRMGCASFLDFRHATFTGPIVFSGFRVQDYLGLDQVEFHGDLSLRYVVVGDSLDFSRSSFGGHVRLEGVKLPRIVDLSGVQDIAYGIDLTSARPPDTGLVYVRLLGANLDRIRIDYLRFRLAFPDSASFDERASVYERLLGRFTSDGLVESHKNIDIEYKQFRYKVEQKQYLNLIQRYWWNYGYNREYVFAWSLGFMLLFSLVTASGFGVLSSRVYRVPFLEASEGAARRSCWIRLGKAVMYTGLVFFGIKLDLDKFGPLGWWTGYIFVVYTVGLVCVAYMVAFVLNR